MIHKAIQVSKFIWHLKTNVTQVNVSDDWWLTDVGRVIYTTQYNTTSISRAPWCLRLGRLRYVLRAKGSCEQCGFQSWFEDGHFGERSSVKCSTLMVQRRWKPACRCWSGFVEQAVEVRRKTAATWLAHDAAAAARDSLMCALYVRSATLYEMRSLTGSQCSWHSRGLALARYHAGQKENHRAHTETVSSIPRGYIFSYIKYFQKKTLVVTRFSNELHYLSSLCDTLTCKKVLKYPSIFT